MKYGFNILENKEIIKSKILQTIYSKLFNNGNLFVNVDNEENTTKIPPSKILIFISENPVSVKILEYFALCI